MKNLSDYDAYMRFISVLLSLAIFAFIIPTVGHIMDHLFICELSANELTKPQQALIIILSYFITIPIYTVFHKELIK